MKNKSCSLDPIPSWLLELGLHELAPVIKNIYSSFQNGVIPSAPKLKLKLINLI